MESLEKRNRHRGSLGEVAHIAWPIIVSMLAYTAMGVVDTLVVGWLGVTELAAVGLATTAVFFINGFFLGTLHGVKVVAAQATGAGNAGRASRAGWQGALIAAPMGLVVIALAGWDEHLFRLMGGPPEVQALARDYFRVRVLASPVWYLTLAMSDYFQGTGDTRTPMKVNLLVNGLNIVGDVVLVFGFGEWEGLGVTGAAWSTVFACAVGWVVMTPMFVRAVGVRPSLDYEVAREVVRVGVPIGVRYVLDIGGFTVFTAIVARVGAAELAANQIAMKVISISFLPGHGLGEAATVLVGQYVGANDREAARAAFRSALKLAVGLMGAFGVVFWVWPTQLLGFFSEDPEVLKIGAGLLFLGALFQVFDAVVMTAAGALNGAGDTRFTMLASIAGSWFVLVPLAYLFGVALGWGAYGAWLALTIEIAILSVVMTLRWRSGTWAPLAA